MQFIKDLREGSKISGIYMCKNRTAAVTKNGKQYDNVILADKTGNVDAKIWDPNSPAIDEFDKLDYVDIVGDVSMFAGSLQISIKRARKAHEDEYNPADYLPVSRYNINQMYDSILKNVESVENPYLSQLLKGFFVEDEKFTSRFRSSSAAKTVHHGFVGGLLEHTLRVTLLCSFFADSYKIINRDLLITAALCHDIGKIQELSAFPENDYTDDGQLLGHIMIGAEMIHDAAGQIPGFPAKLESELKHCILAHHGELEYGSPKRPALLEALVLNLADNADAKIESLTEILEAAGNKQEWLGYSKLFESNLRKTSNLT